MRVFCLLSNYTLQDTVLFSVLVEASADGSHASSGDDSLSATATGTHHVPVWFPSIAEYSGIYTLSNFNLLELVPSCYSTPLDFAALRAYQRVVSCGCSLPQTT